MFKHFDLPSIVVVDSDKDLDDQLRTMIILYRPPDPEQMEKRSSKSKNKSDSASRTTSFNHKKSEISHSISDSGGGKHNSRERQNNNLAGLIEKIQKREEKTKER